MFSIHYFGINVRSGCGVPVISKQGELSCSGLVLGVFCWRGLCMLYVFYYYGLFQYKY